VCCVLCVVCLFVECWLCVVGCVLLVVCCWLPVIGCVLVVEYQQYKHLILNTSDPFCFTAHLVHCFTFLRPD